MDQDVGETRELNVQKSSLQQRLHVATSVGDQYSGGVWALVPVDLAKLSGKAKRINITLPERALKELDSRARTLGETRSGFLLRAALEFIARHPDS